MFLPQLAVNCSWRALSKVVGGGACYGWRLGRLDQRMPILQRGVSRGQRESLDFPQLAFDPVDLFPAFIVFLLGSCRSNWPPACLSDLISRKIFLKCKFAPLFSLSVAPCSCCSCSHSPVRSTSHHPCQLTPQCSQCSSQTSALLGDVLKPPSQAVGPLS